MTIILQPLRARQKLVHRKIRLVNIVFNSFVIMKVVLIFEFEEIIELAESKISENCRTEIDKPQIQNSTQKLNSAQALDSKKVQYSTATHFAVLAAKIKEANMPPYIINRIEAQVSAFVFEQIESFYSTMNETT